MKMSSPLNANLSGTAVVVLILCLIEVIAVFNSLPEINDAIWQDEAVTLMFFSAQGIAHPFLHYMSPNDHVLFSSMMAGWLTLFPGGVDIPTLRLLPLLLFLAAVPATVLAAARIGGWGCGLLAGLLFASSAVTANFATQLRGYGPSWLFLSLLLLCAVNVLNTRPIAWRIGYIISCLAAVAILPTNFFLSLVIAISVSLYFALMPENRAARARPGIVILLISPFFGLLTYAAVWEDLLRYSAISWSTWTRLGLMQNWLYATLSDLVLLIPFIVAGALLGFWGLIQIRRGDREHISKEFILIICLALGFAVSVLAMPKIPFPRTMVPFLPIWYCILAFVVVYGIKQLIDGRRRILFLGSFVLTALSVLSSLPLQSCKSATKADGDLGYDLCYQFFHDEYHPDRVVAIWKALGNKNIPIVSDFEAFYALRILNVEMDGMKIHEYRRHSAADNPNPLIVVNSYSDLIRITKFLELDILAYKKIADTGYFDIYAKREFNRSASWKRKANG